MPSRSAAKSKTVPFPARMPDGEAVPARAPESEGLHVVNEAPLVRRPGEPQPHEPQPTEPQPETKAPPATKAPAEPQAKSQKKGVGRRLILPIIGLGLLAAAGYYGYHYWIDGRFMISTDDAYVQADMSFVAPKVTGYVQSVVDENQRVKAGDPLVKIDEGDYRIAVSLAESQIATQHKTVERIAAQTQAANAALQQAEAHRQASQSSVRNAERTAARAQQLLTTKVGTQAQVDDTQTALDQARAAVAGDDAAIAAATANISVLEAQRAEAESLLQSLDLNRQKAERDLNFTVLKAPFDGVVGNVSVEEGDMVSVGQKLAAVVPVDRVYVIANFKETQLAKLKPGETVKMSVDALDGDDITGTVSSLAPASGAVFSLLPPENATGNFTKVVQRVPVRIDVSQKDLDRGVLRAGLSVIVKVDSRTAPPTP